MISDPSLGQNRFKILYWNLLLSDSGTYQSFLGYNNTYWENSSKYCANQELSSPTNASGCHPKCRDVIIFLSLARECLSKTIINQPMYLSNSRFLRHPSIQSMDISRHEPFHGMNPFMSMSSQNCIPTASYIETSNPWVGVQCQHTRVV